MEKYVARKEEGKEVEVDYYEVEITGDASDAAYVTEVSTFNQVEFDRIVDELIHLMENHSDSHEMANYSWDADDGGDLYIHLPRTPSHDYCHTLESLEITMYDQDGDAYDVYLKYEC